MNTIPYRRLVTLLLVVLFCLPTLGCYSRPRRVPVAGIVTLDGEPLTMGDVRFVPGDARAAHGTIGPDGRFRLTTFEEGDGCVVGSHTVEVIARQTLSPTAIRHLVPPQYGSAATSDLVVEITGPVQDLELKLVSDGWEPFVERTETSGDADPTRLE